LEAKLLLILQGAHGGHGAEVVVEGGDADGAGEVFDAKGLGEVGSDPGDSPGGAVALVSECGEGTEAGAFGSAQDAVDVQRTNEA
jgi:hypothetical protein